MGRAEGSARALRALPNAVVTCVLLVGASFAVGAAGPSGSCRAAAVGRNVSVRVQLEALFEPELLRLVSLGLDGNIRVEVELLRHRPLWFPSRTGQQSVELNVAREPAGEGFLLDGERLADPQRLLLSRILLPLETGDPEQHEVRVRVQLRVITPASLGKMATWVAGGDAKQEQRSALSAGVLALLADELARTLEFSCAVHAK